MLQVCSNTSYFCPTECQWFENWFRFLSATQHTHSISADKNLVFGCGRSKEICHETVNRIPLRTSGFRNTIKLAALFRGAGCGTAMVCAPRLVEATMGTGTGPKGGNGTQGSRGGVRGARCIALIGPFASGKTTLLEAILARTGGITRPGSIAAKSTVGDASPEARDHAMSVALNVADVTFLDETFTFIDCPGSVEFAARRRIALAGMRSRRRCLRAGPKARAGAANDLEKTRRHRSAASAVPEQDRQPAPRGARHHSELATGERQAAGAAADTDLGKRHRDRLRRSRVGAGLRLSRARRKRRSWSCRQRLPPREKEARFQMLEKLADYDDALMEQLLSDIPPPNDQVFNDLRQGIARRLDLSGAARFSRARQWHTAAA